MWHLLWSLSGIDDQTREFIREITKSIMQTMTLFLAGLFLFWAYLLAASQPVKYLSRVMLVALPVLVTAWLTLSLLEKRPLLTQLVWQGGLLGAVALALHLFRVPEVAFFLVLLPLIAAVTSGWIATVAVLAAIAGLVALFLSSPGVFPLPVQYGVTILLCAAMIGLLAVISIATLLAVVKRAFCESRMAREQMEDTRRQRMELIQTQHDLIQANRELARLSDRLKALTQVAEDARRVKEEFVANVSHELRTPLNMIIGFSELITKTPHVYGHLPPTLLADIAAIQRNSQHLAELVNDVLDLSQIEAGRMALVKDWTSLHELVEAAVSATKVLFDMKGLYLKTLLPAEPVAIFCDRTRIREVLLNLLSNAGRFTDQGGVTVQAQVKEGELILSVSDTGTGISLEHQNRLFEPFQQLDNSIRRQGGSGLGLSISKRFVEMHDGKMWFESTLGAGTTFTFSLPLVRPAGAGLPAGARRWVTPYHQIDIEFHRSRVPTPVVLPRFVLLDRGSGLQRLFNRYLDDVEVLNVQTLDQALELIARSPCQGLIINGATTGVTSEMVNRSSNLPFVTPVLHCWITATDETTRNLGVENYLIKPVSREKLLEQLAGLSNEVHTILLVDDDIEVLQLFARILISAERGYIVLRAKNGKQALEILRERRPDVMLIDLVMPEMDGFQVLREKNRDAAIRDIPVIVVSSKDPTGAPIISDRLMVDRKGGLSARELVTCVRAVSEILAPEALHGDRALRAPSPA